jgi:small subunit ribosomal protein S21
METGSTYSGPVASRPFLCYNTFHMVQVTRKDEREANENIIRRFNRKVLQSGVLATAKGKMRFSKPISKVDRRAKAIIRKERKADKLAKARLGIR